MGGNNVGSHCHRRREEKLHGLFLHFNFLCSMEGIISFQLYSPVLGFEPPSALRKFHQRLASLAEVFFIEKLLLKNFLNASNLLVNKRPRRAKRINGKNKLASRGITNITDRLQMLSTAGELFLACVRNN